MKEVPAAINPYAAVKQLRGRVSLRLPLLGSRAHGGVVVGGSCEEMGKGQREA